MVDNEKALNKLFNLAKETKAGNIKLHEFLKKGEIIIFNEITSAGVSNFNDGLKNGGYLNILIYVLKVIEESDLAALERLEIDLYIKESSFVILQY